MSPQKLPWNLENKGRGEWCEQLVHRLVIIKVIRRWAGWHTVLQATPGDEENKGRREYCEQLVHRLIIFKVVRRWAGWTHFSHKQHLVMIPQT